MGAMITLANLFTFYISGMMVCLYVCIMRGASGLNSLAKTL